MSPTPRASGLPMALLFFASGATALIYELVWFRRFAQIWGSSSHAMGAVVAAFLLGLGLGARYLGSRARRAPSPLARYAWFEAGICLLAGVSLFAIEALRVPSAWAYDLLGPSGVLGALVRLVLALVVLGPPTVLMGATLPLLVAELELAGREGWRGTALLYATNTLGAAIGCFAAGFFLLPHLGLKLTLIVAIALNLVVVLGAWGLSRGSPRRDEESPRPAPEAVPLPRLSLAAFLLGVSALSLHMIWARQLSLVLGGTTFSFTAMLFTVLVGIAVGSALVEPLARRVPSVDRLFVALAFVLVLSVAGGQLLLPALSDWVGNLRAERSALAWNAVLCSSVSAVLEFLPALASGAMLPLLVH